MKLIINGELKEFNDNITIKQLLKSLNLNDKPVVIELNKEIIPKENYNRKLSPNDKLEIVTFVGGG